MKKLESFKTLNIKKQGQILGGLAPSRKFDVGPSVKFDTGPSKKFDD